MKRGRKMAAPWWGIVLLFMVLVVHDVEGYSDLPPLKNYNLNETSESTHIKRILAFGDSLTEGFLAGGRKFYPYTTKLEEKLNAHFNWSRWEVLNEGISGECVFTEMVTRLPRVLERVGNRINLVIILGGTNDFHKLDCTKRVNVAHEVITLHKLVHKEGLKSVLVTVPDCSNLGSKCDKARQKVNEKLRRWAVDHKKNTLLCDLARFMPMGNISSFDRKVYWDDEVHPSKIGYDKIAALLFHTIRVELEPPILEDSLPEVVPPSKHKKKATKKGKSKSKKKVLNKKGSKSKKLHTHHHEKNKAKSRKSNKHKFTKHKSKMASTFSSPSKMGNELESSFPVDTSSAQLPSTNSTQPTFAPFLNGTNVDYTNSSSTPYYMAPPYGGMSAFNYSSPPSAVNAANAPAAGSYPYASYNNYPSWNLSSWNNSSWNNSSPYSSPSSNSTSNFTTADSSSSSNSSASPYNDSDVQKFLDSNFTSDQTTNSTDPYNENDQYLSSNTSSYSYSGNDEYPSSNTSDYSYSGNDEYPSSNTSSYTATPYGENNDYPSNTSSPTSGGDTSSPSSSSNSTTPYKTDGASDSPSNSTFTDASAADPTSSNSTANYASVYPSNANATYNTANTAPNLNSNDTNKYSNNKVPSLGFVATHKHANRYAIH